MLSFAHFGLCIIILLCQGKYANDADRGSLDDQWDIRKETGNDPGLR